MAQPTLSPQLQRLALINVCLGQFMTALDLFYQLAGCPGGRFHGVESSS
jgi:hypothetical protein